MNVWDSLREFERFRKSLEPLRERLAMFVEPRDHMAQVTRSFPVLTKDLLQQISFANEFLESPTLKAIKALQSSIPPGFLEPPLVQAVKALQSSMPSLPKIEFPQNLFASRIALEAAIRPFPDLKGVLPLLVLEENGIAAAIRRMNQAFAIAPFLGEIQLSQDEDEEREEDEAGVFGSGFAKRVEEQLIEVVPPEALENLRRVEFAPLRMLDRVLRSPKTMHDLSSREFEEFIACLLDELGFERVVLTPPSGDGGRDVEAVVRVHGIPILCAFECKRFAPDRPVGVQIARALLGTLTARKTRAAKGILVTTSSFTAGARDFILTEPTLDGKDFDDIVKWLQDYGRKRGQSGEGSTQKR